MNTDDVRDWFEAAFTVRLAWTGTRNPEVATLWRCKVCAALVEGEHRAAHRYWHLTPSSDNRQ